MSKVGVDLGGTKILVARVHHGKAHGRVKRPTPTGGPDAVADAIAEMVAEAGGASHIGIGAPGSVKRGTGVVAHAPNIPGFDHPVPLAELVAARVEGSPEILVDNDVNVAVLGEHHHGAAKGADDALGVWVGTGVGGGLILHGRPRHGEHGLAGEIGHTTVEPGGRLCGCGGHGHLEAYAGRAAMEAEARRRHDAGEATVLVDLAGDERMKSSIWAKALDAGDPIATELIAGAVDALATAISTATVLLDLETAVIGGGLGGRLGTPFVERIQAAVQERIWGAASVTLVASALLDDAGVVGAATLFE